MAAWFPGPGWRSGEPVPRDANSLIEACAGTPVGGGGTGGAMPGRHHGNPRPEGPPAGVRGSATGQWRRRLQPGSSAVRDSELPHQRRENEKPRSQKISGFAANDVLTEVPPEERAVLGGADDEAPRHSVPAPPQELLGAWSRLLPHRHVCRNVAEVSSAGGRRTWEFSVAE